MYRENISGVSFPHLQCPRFRNACFSNYSVDHSSLASKVNAVTLNLMTPATNDARLLITICSCYFHVLTRINHLCLQTRLRDSGIRLDLSDTSSSSDSGSQLPVSSLERLIRSQ